jgi:hypothetical protein
MTNRIMYRIQIMGRWLQSSPPANSGHKLLRIALYVLILTIAFGLRMQLAAIAYPAQMDSTHMIHQGILWAQGEPGALSTIWQEAPVLTAGIAYRLGYNPAEALQWSTVLYGTILVGMTMLLTRRLFDSDTAAWITGAWTASNSTLLNYSVNSMPEIGFAACLIAAYAVMAHSICGRDLKFSHVLAGYALLGLGMYFKPLDSLTAMVLTTGWLFLVRLKCPLRTIVHLLSGFIIYLGVVAPHYVLQNQGNDSRTPQLANRSAGLVKGLRAYDSRYENAPGDAWFVEEMDEFRQLGTLKWLWRHRQEVAQRFPSNLIRSVRIYGQFIFPHAFRIGNAWWILMLAVILAIQLAGQRWRPFSWLFIAAMAFPLGVSLSYVYERWLIIYMPLLIILIVGHLVLSPSLWGCRWKKAAWTITLLAMVENSKTLSFQSHRDRVWWQENQQTIALWLKDAARSDERIMALSPSISLDMDIDHPRRWVRLPNAPLDHIDRICTENNVSYVVVCDSSHPHWPANQLTQGEPAPPNWTLVKENKFERLHPIWGDEQETYQIYKRYPSITENLP